MSELSRVGLAGLGSKGEVTETGRMFVLDEATYGGFQDMMGAIAREQLVEQHVTHDYYGTSSELEVRLGAGVPVPDTPSVARSSLGPTTPRLTSWRATSPCA